MATFGRNGPMAANESDGATSAISAVAAKAKAKAKSWSRSFAPVRSTGSHVDSGFPEGGMSDSAKRRLVADFVEEHLEQPQWYDEFEMVHAGSPTPFPEENARVSGYGGNRSMAMGSASDGGPSCQAPVAPVIDFYISFKGSTNIVRPRGVSEFAWGQTVNELPKFAEEEWSYNEMAQKASSDRDVARYLAWLKETYGADGAQQIRDYGYTSSQGFDFAAWLCYVGFTKEAMKGPKGFNRRTKG